MVNRRTQRLVSSHKSSARTDQSITLHVVRDRVLMRCATLRSRCSSLLLARCRCKMTNSEAGTRVPLFVRAPWIKQSIGLRTPHLAELVDLFPTISDLAGLKLPAGEGGARLGGVSLKPIMAQPDMAWSKVALSQFPRCWQNNTGFDMNQVRAAIVVRSCFLWLTVSLCLPIYKMCWCMPLCRCGQALITNFPCTCVHLTQILGPGDEVNKTVSLTSMSDCHWVRPDALDFMGYSMRTDTHRLVQWMVWDGAELQPKWDHIVGLELYDHSSNSQLDNSYLDDTENENLAAVPAHAALLEQLQAQLRREAEKWLKH